MTDNQEGKFPLHAENAAGQTFHYANPRVFRRSPAGNAGKSRKDFWNCAT